MASRRSRAREMALQMLYQQDLNPDVTADTARELIVERLRDEALELAKRYGTAQSSQFVNGILDRLIPGGGRKTEPPISE